MTNPLCPKTERERDEALARAETAEHQLREARTQVERVEREAGENREAAITERSLRRQAEKDANETWDQLKQCQEAFCNLVEAGDAVDSFLSADGPPFKFLNKRIANVAAETSLLSLHDYLNDAHLFLSQQSTRSS